MAKQAMRKKPSATKVESKMCAMCHETKPISDFYYTDSPMFAMDERLPFCKECCKKYPLNEDGSLNYQKFQELLMRTDRPLYYDVLKRIYDTMAKKHSYASEEEVTCMGREAISEYYRRMGAKGYRGKTYMQSMSEGNIGPFAKTMSDDEKKETKALYDLMFNGQASIGVDIEEENIKKARFEVTPEMREMFGDGFSVMEYKKMSEKYDKLKLNYQIQTSLHQEALITYVRFKVKEEIATANGKVDEAKKWYDAAQNAADKAKLSPKQLTKADLQKGLNSFSEISQAMEQAVDIIEVLPRYKSQPADSVDFNIWCYINYARKLKGLPTVEYSDIYKFYDDMKEDYISQYGDPYGIFIDDVTVTNRGNVEKFITLPADYEDIGEVDEEGDDE